MDILIKTFLNKNQVVSSEVICLKDSAYNNLNLILFEQKNSIVKLY